MEGIKQLKDLVTASKQSVIDSALVTADALAAVSKMEQHCASADEKVATVSAERDAALAKVTGNVMSQEWADKCASGAFDLGMLSSETERENFSARLRENPNTAAQTIALLTAELQKKASSQAGTPLPPDATSAVRPGSDAKENAAEKTRRMIAEARQTHNVN